MATLDSIQSKVWGISVLGSGIIAEGIASLRQCISIILHTSLGSDPLRPLFGSRVYKYQDAPVNIAIPNIKASIIEALRIWEKRIKVQSVNHRIVDAGHLEFEIVYLLVDENLLDSIIFRPGGVISGTSNMILQAIFPPGSDTLLNTIAFKLNDTEVHPLPPITGFPSTTQTFDWCVANWGNYGTWRLLSDRIILELNPGSYFNGSLTMTVMAGIKRFAAIIPPLTDPGTSYNGKFNPDFTGLLETSVLFSGYILSKEKLLLVAQLLWASYGTWAVEYIPDSLGDFSDDFSDDFDIVHAHYELVLYSPTVNTALLDVEII